MKNSTKANAKADNVFGLSNSWSPVSNPTICTVTVLTLSKGLKVRFAAKPAAITTIIVSPIAREKANKKLPTMPWNEAGIITCFVVSDSVAPIASEPSLSERGTAVNASSVNDATKGIIIIPRTEPAINALSELIFVKDKNAPMSLKNGATVITAKKP